MTQIGYETSHYSSKIQKREQKESFLMRLVLRTGIVKDKKQANIAFLIMTGVFFLTTLIILFSNGIFDFNSSGGTNGEEYTDSEYMTEENTNI
ncbi:MAG: hypothetical protein KAI72_07640 [Candidatus Pacebacteria bacterium]|nr:hypothetical protein [Candidatus Paceibacterota bacterium]